MLRIENLQGGYGQTKVLFDISLDVQPGEIVGLLGRNGMGKTTTIMSIFGLLATSGGSIAFDGVDIAGDKPHHIARRGLAIVPEGRQVFPLLTVDEHLHAIHRPAAHDGTSRWTPDSIYEFFPSLAERSGNYGNQLSGGEQQMLAIGRALVTNPRLLVLDDATEGLAPVIRRDIWEALRVLKSEGQSILIVDARLRELLALTERNFIVEKGHTVWSGTSAELSESKSVTNRHLGVG